MPKPTVRDVERLAQRLSDAELRVVTLRDQLDAMMCAHHEAGEPIVALARAAKVSRETVYKAIARYRSRV